MKKLCLGTLVLLLAVSHARAALLIGVPTYNQPVTSQLGPIGLNTLTITPLPNGFSVSGQVGIVVPAGSVAGTLAAWVIDYPIDPSYAFNPSLSITTSLLGFSAPPLGVVGSTSGIVESAIVTLPGTVLGPSISLVPMSLVAGVDSPAWGPSPLVGVSTTFPFIGAASMVLRQRFQLDGIYSAGPGGMWIIDVPVTTIVNGVPEPSTALLATFGFAGFAAWRYRRKRFA